MTSRKGFVHQSSYNQIRERKKEVLKPTNSVIGIRLNDPESRKLFREQNFINQTLKLATMDTKDKKFEEQDHPLKNTDHAFVQVGKDGSPVIPKQTNEEQKEQTKTDDHTTIEHR